MNREFILGQVGTEESLFGGCKMKDRMKTVEIYVLSSQIQSWFSVAGISKGIEDCVWWMGM